METGNPCCTTNKRTSATPTFAGLRAACISILAFFTGQFVPCNKSRGISIFIGVKDLKAMAFWKVVDSVKDFVVIAGQMLEATETEIAYLVPPSV
jgi:hypothetical protein